MRRRSCVCVRCAIQPAHLGVAEDKSVTIVGGGLAGLTLALQLRKEVPEAQVVVIEKTDRKLLDAAHKVGESSVELGSHYFGHVLGLDGYMRRSHLIKNGLRFFVGSDTRLPIAERIEIGPPGLPKVPSYQIDRGRFERDLRTMLVERGVKLIEGAGVKNIALSKAGDRHVVHYRNADGVEKTIYSRWVVDASGRRRLIQTQKKLLRDNGHHASAAWFRIKGHLDIKELVPETAEQWHTRDPEHIRFLSTNHLMGLGYWVWLIPLGPPPAQNKSESYDRSRVPAYTSIGVVADHRHHALSDFGTREKMLDWLEEHEPVLRQALAQPDREMVDFLRLKDFSFTTEQFISEERWSCVGEAAMFPDPFYSPGSDFIALENGFTTMAIKRDFAGQDIKPYIERFNEMMLAVDDYTVSLFRDASHIQTKPHVFMAKLYWDNFGYWSFLCPYFFQGVYRWDAADHDRFYAIGRKFGDLVPKAQKLLSAWARAATEKGLEPHIPFPSVPSYLANMHFALTEALEKDAFLALLEERYALFEELYLELALRALRELSPEKAKSFIADAELPRLNPTSERLEAADKQNARYSPITRDITRIMGRPHSFDADRKLHDILREHFFAQHAQQAAVNFTGG